MAKATWDNILLAESEETELVDGYTYFPPSTVRWELLKETTHTTVCSTKGTASYYDVVVGGKINKNSAWAYKAPFPSAKNIVGWIGFWKGIRVDK